MNDKDNLHQYRLRCQRSANVAKCDKRIWTIQLSPLLTGKVIEVYDKLPSEKRLNYESLRVILLVKYDFTERRLEKFRKAKLENRKSPSQFIFRMKMCFTSGWR